MKVMKRAWLPLWLLLIVAAPLALADPAPSKSPAQTGETSVGEFAMQLARLLSPDADEKMVMTPELARKTLEQSGLELKLDSSDILTQGEFAEILRQVGLNMTVAHPAQPLSSEQLRGALQSFGTYFASRGSDAPLAVASRPGGNYSAPESFADCSELTTVLECRSCCLALGASSKSCGRACGRAHAAQKVSASEPTP